MSAKVNNWSLFLKQTERSIIAGESLTKEQARRLLGIPEELIGKLAKTADEVRRCFSQQKIDLCSIINARSGRCPEDCKFCVQSSRYKTKAPVYPMKPAADLVRAAKAAEQNGAHRFCIVTSGEALSDRDFDTVLQAVVRISAETNLKRCASVGRLSRERTIALKKAGLDRYHHNIETAPSFFPEICTTHSFDDKAATITHLKEAGVETCVGGILNLGETPEQRLEFAFALRELDPVSVPINFLNPRPGTPLAGRAPMPAMEAAKYLAILRLVLPKAQIRLAGGRLETFGERPELPFASGANALLIGDLLTTKGPQVDSDLALLRSMGFDVESDDRPS